MNSLPYNDNDDVLASSRLNAKPNDSDGCDCWSSLASASDQPFQLLLSVGLFLFEIGPQFPRCHSSETGRASIDSKPATISLNLLPFAFMRSWKFYSNSYHNHLIVNGGRFLLYQLTILVRLFISELDKS